MYVHNSLDKNLLSLLSPFFLPPSLSPPLSLSFFLSLPLSLALSLPSPSSHFFLKLAEDSLLYLDPHTVQPTVNVTDHSHIPDQTYHCSSPDRMPLRELDPSIALAFFCKDEEDLDDLVRRLKSVHSLSHTHTHTHTHTPSHIHRTHTTCID